MSNNDLIFGALLAFILAIMIVGCLAVPIALGGDQPNYPVLEREAKYYNK